MIPTDAFISYAYFNDPSPPVTVTWRPYDAAQADYDVVYKTPEDYAQIIAIMAKQVAASKPD